MTPARILVVQLRRIGDVILTLPASSALQRRYPDAVIDFLVEPPSAEAVIAAKVAHEVLIYNGKSLVSALRWISLIRARRYDLVVDFMGNPRTALLTALAGAPRRAGPGHVFHRWAYNLRLPQSAQTVYAAREKIRMLEPLGVPDDDQALPVIASWSGRRPVANRVGFFPASRKITRQWPADKYAELGRLMRDRIGAELVIFWGPAEKSLAESVVKGIGGGATLSAKTDTLASLAEQLSQCRLVVTNCAGPKHLAVAIGVPTLTIHSSSDPKAWTPSEHPLHATVRRDELHCIGCRRNVCPYKLECLKGLETRRVFEAALNLLGKVPA
jgi:heptosyltransferase III